MMFQVFCSIPNNYEFFYTETATQGIVLLATKMGFKVSFILVKVGVVLVIVAL